MKRALLALALALAGCDPLYVLTAHVTDPTGAPIEGAALAQTCAQAAVDQAALTDRDGTAAVGGMGFTFPACDLTIASPGFTPYATSYDLLCDGKRESCDRVRTIEVVLAPD